MPISSDKTGPYQLPIAKRPAWKKAVRKRAVARGVRGSRLNVLNAILEHCNGKPDAWPKDRTIAEETGLKPATVNVCLADLAALRVVAIRRRKGSLRRIIVVLDHPQAAEFLADPGLKAWKSRRKSRSASESNSDGDRNSIPMAVGIQFLPESESSEVFQGKIKENDDDRKEPESSSSDLSILEEKTSETAPGAHPGAIAAPTDETPIREPKAPQTAIVAAQSEDLEPLVEKAEARFGSGMGERVSWAVKAYGQEWVELVLWGVPSLKEWGGVLRTLSNWKNEGGPCDRVRDRARQATPKPAPPPPPPPTRERLIEVAMDPIRMRGAVRDELEKARRGSSREQYDATLVNIRERVERRSEELGLDDDQRAMRLRWVDDAAKMVDPPMTAEEFAALRARLDAMAAEARRKQEAEETKRRARAASYSGPIFRPGEGPVAIGAIVGQSMRSMEGAVRSPARPCTSP